MVSFLSPTSNGACGALADDPCDGGVHELAHVLYICIHFIHLPDQNRTERTSHSKHRVLH